MTSGRNAPPPKPHPPAINKLAKITNGSPRSRSVTILDDSAAAPQQSRCAATQRRSYPVDKIFPPFASLTAVTEVEVIRATLVNRNDVTLISVGYGRVQRLDGGRYQPTGTLAANRSCLLITAPQ